LRLGITTIEGLANADANFIGTIKFLGAARAQKIIDEAKRMLQGVE
jgi:predicted RecB family nuclease